jgi:poly-gamma-glutamate synthesis protein (capsule biosynthesis protein)
VIVPARCVQAAIDERNDNDYPYNEVRGILQDADLAVGTLNATFSDYPPHTGCVPTYVLVGDAENADAAARAGFDVMSVATNHIKNCGLANCGDRAFFDTLDNLRRVGILPVGAAANHAEAMQPVVVEVNGIRFGIVSLGQIEPLAFAGTDTPGIAVLTPENLRAAIAAARQVSDVVIAMPHWGPEDVPWPNHIQRDLAHHLVEAGADIVVGNHTHVVQAMQAIDGVPVFYGLGNFVFDQGLRDHKQGAILTLRFDGKRYVGYEFIPTHVDRDGTVHIADASESAEVLQRIDQASRELGWRQRPAYLPSMLVKETEGLSQEEIVRRLFEQWLEHYQAPVWSGMERITAAEISAISVDKSGQANPAPEGVETVARVVFSVRPQAPGFSEWEQGDGQVTLDGWVRDKSRSTALRQSGGRYWLEMADSDVFWQPVHTPNSCSQ